MELKYDHQTLDINGLPVAEVISALQAWETETPEATEAVFNIYPDGDSAFAEISFYRPYTREELEAIESTKQKVAEWQEQHDRETYERLKEKYGN